MLASDLANKEFTGAVANPDELLHVEFYWHEPIDKWESEKTGKLVKGEKIPYIRIMRPGDQLSIIETAANDWHKSRFPHRWMAWQIKEGLLEGEYQIAGWKLEEWEELNPEQIHELKFLRFSTVEQIAGASDAQVQRLGMGGLALREKAKVALRNKMGSEVKEEMAAKDKELAEMRERMAKLEAMVMAASQPQGSATANAEEAGLPSAADPASQPRAKRKYTRKGQAA